MAKKRSRGKDGGKVVVIRPNTGQHLLIALGLLGGALVGTTLLVVGVIPADFRIGVVLLSILLAGGGIAYGVLVVLPSSIVLEADCLLVRSVTGKVRARIPYANIAQVRLHTFGEGDQETDVVGIDLVKAKARDTWFPKTFAGRVYDVQLPDRWVKSPSGIVRMLQERIDRHWGSVGTK